MKKIYFHLDVEVTAEVENNIEIKHIIPNLEVSVKDEKEQLKILNVIVADFIPIGN